MRDEHRQQHGNGAQECRFPYHRQEQHPTPVPEQAPHRHLLGPETALGRSKIDIVQHCKHQQAGAHGYKQHHKRAVAIFKPAPFRLVFIEIQLIERYQFHLRGQSVFVCPVYLLEIFKHVVFLGKYVHARINHDECDTRACIAHVRIVRPVEALHPFSPHEDILVRYDGARNVLHDRHHRKGKILPVFTQCDSPSDRIEAREDLAGETLADDDVVYGKLESLLVALSESE